MENQIKALFNNSEYEKVCKEMEKVTDVQVRQKLLSIHYASLLALGEYGLVLDLASKAKEPSIYTVYALYKLGRYQEAKEELDKHSFSDKHGKRLLEAQILYKMDKFHEAAKVYADLLQTRTDSKDELLANYLACIAGLAVHQQDVSNDLKLDIPASPTYEQVYNHACIDIHQGDLSKAKLKLSQALTFCEKSMKAEDYSREEIEAELLEIKAQLAFVALKEGATDEAKDQMENILTSKESAFSARLTCLNNLISLSKPEARRKLMKKHHWHSLATGANVKNKWNGWNEAVVRANYALILKEEKKSVRARHYLRRAIEVDPQNPLALTLKAYAIVNKYSTRRKKISEKAIEELKKGFYKCVLVDLLIKRRDLSMAKEILESLPHNFKLRSETVSVALWLADRGYPLSSNLPQPKSSTDQFNYALYSLWTGKNLEDSKEIVMRLYNEQPLNKQYVSALILYYLKTDQLSKATELFMKQFKATPVDSDELEQIWNLTTGVGQKSKYQPQIPVKKAKKRRVLRKKPKNFDENRKPDPERWVPKKLRKAGKKQQQRKAATEEISKSKNKKKGGKRRGGRH